MSKSTKIEVSAYDSKLAEFRARVRRTRAALAREKDPKRRAALKKHLDNAVKIEKQIMHIEQTLKPIRDAWASVKAGAGYVANAVGLGGR